MSCVEKTNKKQNNKSKWQTKATDQWPKTNKQTKNKTSGLQIPLPQVRCHYFVLLCKCQKSSTERI